MKATVELESDPVERNGQVDFDYDVQWSEVLQCNGYGLRVFVGGMSITYRIWLTDDSAMTEALELLDTVAQLANSVRTEVNRWNQELECNGDGLRVFPGGLNIMYRIWLTDDLAMTETLELLDTVAQLAASVRTEVNRFTAFVQCESLKPSI